MMEIALKAVQVSGVPYVEVTADQNAVANRRMIMFAERTRCLYSDAITFDLSPNAVIPSSGLYNLRDTQYTFSKAICELEFITINGSPLKDHNGKDGLIPLKELRNRYPAYLTQTPGTPRYASVISPKFLRIYPVPDGSYANNFASGHYLPTAIDTSGSGNDIEVEFNEEDCEALAIYVAVGLLFATSATQSDYERMAFFSKPAADHMATMISESENQMESGLVRGYDDFSGVVRLG